MGRWVRLPRVLCPFFTRTLPLIFDICWSLTAWSGPATGCVSSTRAAPCILSQGTYPPLLSSTCFVETLSPPCTSRGACFLGTVPTAPRTQHRSTLQLPHTPLPLPFAPFLLCAQRIRNLLLYSSRHFFDTHYPALASTAPLMHACTTARTPRSHCFLAHLGFSQACHRSSAFFLDQSPFFCFERHSPSRDGTPTDFPTSPSITPTLHRSSSSYAD